MKDAPTWTPSRDRVDCVTSRSADEACRRFAANGIRLASSNMALWLHSVRQRARRHRMRFRWRQMAALLLSVGVAAHAQSIPSQTQAPALSDTALEKARAASRVIPGDLPRSLHYLVFASSKSVL